MSSGLPWQLRVGSIHRNISSACRLHFEPPVHSHRSRSSLIQSKRKGARKRLPVMVVMMLFISTSAHSWLIPSSGTICRGFRARRDRTDCRRLLLLFCDELLWLSQCVHLPYNARIEDLRQVLPSAFSATMGWRTADETDHVSFCGRILSAPVCGASRIC
jgi:hypothetical protein